MTIQIQSAAGGSGSVQALVKPNGLDQTAELNAAFAGVDPGATVQLAAAANPAIITSTLTIAQPLTFKGEGMSANYGLAGSNIDTQVAPVTAPFLRGSVLNMTTAATDAIHLTVAGAAVNLYDIGIVFGNQGDSIILENTGHGIVGIPPVKGSNFDQGLMGALWRNVMVYGHDGNHIAVKLLNMEQCTFEHLHTFGGGGLFLDSNGAPPENGFYGNVNLLHPYFVTLVRGSAHMVEIGRTQATGSVEAYGPQCWHYAPQGQIAGKTLLAPTAAQKMWLCPTTEAGNIIESPDFESNLGGVVDTSQGTKIGGDAYLGTSVNTPNSILYLAGGEAALWEGTGTYKTRYFRGGLSSISTASAATAAAGSAAGTSPPAPIATGCTGLRGTIKFGTGTSPAAGEQVVVTIPGDPFNQPKVVLSPNNAATAALGLYKSATTLTTFRVAATNAPAASQANTVYSFDYIVIG